MSEQEKKLDGPDFAQGVPSGDLAEGSMIVGHVAGEAVVLARTGGALFAIGAECTHYHGPLAEGMLVADTVRCPWHHACFSLRTGEALRAPALNPVFWTQQHDLQLSYVGHAAKWDRVEIDGSLAAKDCAVTYRQSGRKLAVLTIGRDRDSLAAEIELEKNDRRWQLTAGPSLLAARPIPSRAGRRGIGTVSPPKKGAFFPALRAAKTVSRQMFSARRGLAVRIPLLQLRVSPRFLDEVGFCSLPSEGGPRVRISLPPPRSLPGGTPRASPKRMDIGLRVVVADGLVVRTFRTRRWISVGPVFHQA
jgi:nitrite reductase/ring-hydroxylating ferredoxin subunit